MRIPVFCSLIPTEFIVSMGHGLDFLDASMCKRLEAPSRGCHFHENLCSYAKKLYEYLAESRDRYDLIIVPTSCDAMKKLHNAIKRDLKPEKVHLLDVPRNKSEDAAKFFAAELEKLTRALSVADKGAKVSRSGRGPSLSSEDHSDRIRIGVLGANVPLGALDKSLKRFGFEAVYLNHCLIKSYADPELEDAARDPQRYARELTYPGIGIILSAQD